MARIVFRKLVLLLLAGCIGKHTFAQRTAPDAKEGEVIIRGKIGNLTPPQQLWLYMGNEKWDTVAVKNGEFEYRKKTLLPAYGAVMVKYKPQRPGQKGGFFNDMEMQNTLFDAGEMRIDCDTLSIKQAVYSGPAAGLHLRFQAYWKKEAAIIRQQKKLAAVFNEASPEQMQDEAFVKNYEQQQEREKLRWDSLMRAEVEQFPESFHSIMCFSSYRYYRQPAAEVEREIAGLFGPTYRAALLQGMDEAEKQLVMMADERVRAASIQLKAGDVPPAFEQQDASGRTVRLSDFRGRYVLLDFWASWCLPCRKVNPDLVEVYAKHKGKQFEILGISLDSDSLKWQEAIKADGLAWPHVSDLKGWQNGVAKLYGVQAIPQNFLVGPDGRIVARNLNVEELDEKLEELL